VTNNLDRDFPKLTIGIVHPSLNPCEVQASFHLLRRIRIANSLFHKILPVTPIESVFCTAKSRYPLPNYQRFRILAGSTKKIVDIYLSNFCAATHPNSLKPSDRIVYNLPSILHTTLRTRRIPLALDDHIYNLRREKLKQIEALGQATYRSKYEFTHTLEQILADYTTKTGEELEQSRVNVRVAGRIMAIRLMGKAGFAHLQQGGKRLQIYVKKDAVADKGFELYKLLDLGDHIGVSGYLFRTRTGELSVHVEQIEFLSKDLLPLPIGKTVESDATAEGGAENRNALTDVEMRYRQRYVDLVVNPEVREVFLKRTKLVQSMRRTLDAHGFIEVETPMMQPIAGGAVARPFVTHHNTLDMDLYLRIAPELYLKRLVVGGLDRVYEINRNFRNEGLGWRWNPEFTMLEFYQAYTDYQGVMDLTQEIITQAAKDVTGGTKTKWGEQEIDWSNWQRMTMREAIIRYWPEAAGAKPEMSDFVDSESVKKLVDRFNSAHSHMAYAANAPAGKNIAALFEAAAEEHLTQPTIIYEYPTAISPLSKQKPDEPDWTERWEIFVGGMEISNGFSELNDPEDQRRRFEGQLKERERGDDEAHQMDEDYIRALSYGMPPAGGVGVGVDRLCMLLTDSHTIRDVILFPLLRPDKTSTTEDPDSGGTAGKLPGSASS
jgi:lysyl-tRNA synthetase, class II